MKETKENNKKKSKKGVKLMLAAIFLFILGLSAIGWWNYNEFQKSLSKVNLLNLPKFSPESQKEPIKQNPPQEFLVPAKDLKITYPSSWQKIEPSAYNFEALNTEKAKTLFYGIKADAKKMKIAWLIIQKLNFGEERNVEKIIDEIKSEAESHKTNIEIKNTNVKENTAEFEINQSQEGYSLKGKEKIILTKENIYSITVFSLSSDWNIFREEADKILDSAQILDNK